MTGASRGGSLGETTVGPWIAFPRASTCSGNAAYSALGLSASVITIYHEQAARVKLGLALAGCNGKNTSKPRLVIDAGIMKEIRDNLEGGFRFGQGHVGMSWYWYYYYTLGRVGVGGREGCFRLESRMLISLRLRIRTNYVIRVMRIKDKGDKALNQIAINR